MFFSNGRRVSPSPARMEKTAIFASVLKNEKMAHLTSEQRYTISVMLKQEYSQNAIAEAIGKDKSVVSREIRRNSDRRSGQYRSDLAQKKYEDRLRGKPKTTRFTEEVKSLVDSLLEEDYSPEQIAGRCRLEGRECVSHERIYQYVWADKKRGGTLYRHLRRKGRKYRKRGLSKDRRGMIQGRVGIEKRPAAVDEKVRFGDLELDTVIGRNHKGAILTVNDRATGLCWLAKLEGKESEPLKEAMIRKLLPFKGLLKTATADNGKEFAGHREFAEALGIDVFFARPYHSWERGANENMNGLIRQYVPKGSSFEDLTDEYIELIQNKLNNRPRKRLGFLTPIEFFITKFAPDIKLNFNKVAFVT